MIISAKIAHIKISLEELNFFEKKRDTFAPRFQRTEVNKDILKIKTVKALSYKTKSVRNEDVQRDWYIIDAEDLILGRMASRIALVLQGKNKPSYTPHVDTGDYVIVVNAEKIKMTGNKMDQRVYHTYSGYPGGQKAFTPRELLEKKPAALVEKSIKGMLPKTKLGRAMGKKLFVYAGPEHNHAAQKPKSLEL